MKSIRSVSRDSTRSPDRLRIRAGIFDFVAVLVVVAIISDEFFAHSSQVRLDEALGLTVVLNVLYHGGMELTVGRSLGKRWTGLVVLSVTGGRPTTRQLVIRNVTRVIDILPNLYIVAVIFVRSDPDRSQRLGDRFARTTVQAVGT